MNTNDLIYSIDLMNETVECRVQNCKRDFARITEKVLSMYPEHIRYFYKFISAYHCEKSIKDEYVGKAVCSKEDIFDERCGKDIARTKAIIKRENAFQSTLAAIYEDIDILMSVNLEINRDHILDKHLNNLSDLYTNCVSLAKIKGYTKDDECDIFNNIDLNMDYTPHCCSLCGDTFLNYKDDIKYSSNEDNWYSSVLPSGKSIEICPTCVDAINKLLD